MRSFTREMGARKSFDTVLLQRNPKFPRNSKFLIYIIQGCGLRLPGNCCCWPVPTHTTYSLQSPEIQYFRNQCFCTCEKNSGSIFAIHYIRGACGRGGKWQILDNQVSTRCAHCTAIFKMNGLRDFRCFKRHLPWDSKASTSKLHKNLSSSVHFVLLESSLKKGIVSWDQFGYQQMISLNIELGLLLVLILILTTFSFRTCWSGVSLYSTVFCHHLSIAKYR